MAKRCQMHHILWQVFLFILRACIPGPTFRIFVVSRHHSAPSQTRSQQRKGMVHLSTWQLLARRRGSTKLYVLTHRIHVWYICLHLPYFTIKKQPNVGKYTIHGSYVLRRYGGKKQRKSSPRRVMYHPFFWRQKQFESKFDKEIFATKDIMRASQPQKNKPDIFATE